MPLNDRVKQTVKAFKGQKSGLPIEMLGFEDAELIENFIAKDGFLRRIPGGTEYANVLNDNESGRITSVHRYKNLWVVQRGNSLCCETAEGSKTFITIVSDLKSNKRLISAQWRDRLLLTNGYDFVYLINRADTVTSSSFVFAKVGMGFFIGQAPGSAYVGIVRGSGQSPNHYDLKFFSPTLNIDVVTNAGNLTGDFWWGATLYDEVTNSESPIAGFEGASLRGLDSTSPNVQFFVNASNDPPVFAAAGVSAKVASIEYAQITQWLKLVTKQALPSLTGTDHDPYDTAQHVTNRHARTPTHFIVYRGQADYNAEPNIDVYGTAYRVANMKSGALTENKYLIPISTFISDGLAFNDNQAIDEVPAVELPNNNSPPPDVDGMLLFDAAINSAKNSTTVSAEYALLDKTKYSTFTAVKVFRDQVFGIGAKRRGGAGFGYEVRIDSAGTTVSGQELLNFDSQLFGSEVSQPDYWTYLWEVGVGDGQNQSGLGVLGDLALLIFKDRSIYYLSGSSPDDFVVRIMDQRHGCVDPGTVQETPIGVIALDNSGFILVNKIGEAEIISDAIKNEIRNIGINNAGSFYSWYDSIERQYKCTTTYGSDPLPVRTFCLNVDTMEWTIENGENGIRGIGRMVTIGSDGQKKELIGSHLNGKLYDLSDPGVVTFNNQQIISKWRSGPVYFEEEQRKKRLKWVYIKARSRTDFTLDVNIIPDFDRTRMQSLTDINSSSLFSKWYASDISSDGSLIWDTGVFGDELPRTFIKIPVSCVGFCFQVELINKSVSGDQAEFVIENISCEAVLMGK